MNPNDAANVAASAGVSGLTPAASASGRMIGTTTAALAVLEVVSDTVIASTTANAVMANALLNPRTSKAPLPMTSASPVESSSDPKTMPVPNNTIVPQSIFAASPHVIVYSRLAQSVGSRNSSPAPTMAAMPSSSRSPSSR